MEREAQGEAEWTASSFGAEEEFARAAAEEGGEGEDSAEAGADSAEERVDSAEEGDDGVDAADAAEEGEAHDLGPLEDVVYHRNEIMNRGGTLRSMRVGTLVEEDSQRD